MHSYYFRWNRNYGRNYWFKKGNNILSMFESDTKIQSGAKVSIIDDGHDVKVGEALLGRVVDAMGTHMMVSQ